MFEGKFVTLRAYRKEDLPLAISFLHSKPTCPIFPFKRASETYKIRRFARSQSLFNLSFDKITVDCMSQQADMRNRREVGLGLLRREWQKEMSS
jgi:hypothetical protein